MNLSPEKIKSFLPFIILGGVAGAYTLIKKGGSVTTSTTSNASPLNGVSGSAEATQSNQNSITDLATQTKNGMTDLAEQTNTALDSQKSFFTSMMDLLTENLKTSNDKITQLTAETSENTIATNKLILDSANAVAVVQNTGTTHGNDNDHNQVTYNPPTQNSVSLGYTNFQNSLNQIVAISARPDTVTVQKGNTIYTTDKGSIYDPASPTFRPDLS